MRTDLPVEIVPYSKSCPFRRCCRKRSLDALLEDWDDIVGQRVDLFIAFDVYPWPFEAFLQVSLEGIPSRRGWDYSRGVGT